MPATRAALQQVPVSFAYPNHVIFSALASLEYAAQMAKALAQQSDGVSPAHRVYQHAVVGAVADIRAAIAEAQALLMR